MTLTEFGLFDKNEEVNQSERQLPHWFQSGVAVFITFRTADSLPREVIRLWQRELREWLLQNDVPLLADEDLPRFDDLPENLSREYRKHHNRRYHWHLDSCHGECALRERKLAEIVMDSLQHFDGQRYDIDSAIVMPNHVHLIAQFHLPTTCREQCKSWLHYTAWKINKHLKRHGEFWQSEPFDHLIRSVQQFIYLRRYIEENGMRANLPPTDYLYWRHS